VCDSPGKVRHLNFPVSQLLTITPSPPATLIEERQRVSLILAQRAHPPRDFSHYTRTTDSGRRDPKTEIKNRDMNSFPVVGLIGYFYSIMLGLMLGYSERPVTDVVFRRI
jgi:hypothetical protein